MPSRTATPASTPPPGPRLWPAFLWGTFAFSSLFFIPQCLDRWLAPRFFFLSAVLVAGIVLLWRDLRDTGDRRLNSFDLLLLAWYGFNLAAVGWSFSWSEGIFYAQKTLLLFLTYRLIRHAFLQQEDETNRALRHATVFLTFAASAILVVQLAMAVSEHGLDNQKLYDYASGVFGNKSLASDFLFFLLVFNVLFNIPGQTTDRKSKRLFGISAGLLLLLILLLQTRTVYLAVIAGAMFYFGGRAWLEPAFARVFRKKILPAVLLAGGLLTGLLLWKGGNSTLAERLNPMNYLESATANERRFVWYKTDLLNADHFWWGVGNGSWKFWLPSKNIEGAYRLQEQNIVFTRAHNDYLEVRAEMGMVGAILFCSLFAVAVLAAIWGMARPETPFRDKHKLLVLMVGLTGYSIIQFFDFPRERIELQIMLAVLLAGVVFYTRPLWNRLPGIAVHNRSRIFLYMALAGLAFNLVIGWNRIRGEIHNVAVLQAMSKKNYALVAREAQTAENRFYEYTDVAVPLAWYEGVAWYQSNQIEKAVASFERAYRLNPWSFQVINNYASALVRNARYRDAIPLYEKAVEINPRYEDGKFNLAYTWYQAGDRVQALDWLNRMDTIPDQNNPEDLQKKNATLGRRAELLKILRAR